jgi:type II secretory pathway component PulF
MSAAARVSMPRFASKRAAEREAMAALDRIRALTGAGMPPGEALRFGAAAGGPPAARLAQAARLVERGQPLSEALRRAGLRLHDADLALLRAGERSGEISAALALLCQRLTQRAAARSRIKRALAYPVALLGVTLAVVVAMTTLVLPSFVSLYATSKAEVPVTTRALMAFGAWLTSYGPAAALLIAASLVAANVARRSSAGTAAAVDRAVLALPFCGALVRARERGEFYSTAACLLRAGVDLETAMDSSAATLSNRAMRSTARAAVKALRRGARLSEAIGRSALDYDNRDAALLKLGEAIGDYPGTCERIAKLEHEIYDAALERISQVIEPAVLLIMAGAVSAAALAVYQPVLGSASLLLGGSS